MSRSILQKEKDRCFLCFRTKDLEEHHVFGGPNRRHSEHYGLKVYLCPICHRDNKKGVHGQRKDADLFLKQYAQDAFEDKWGHLTFMAIFGRNYKERGNESRDRDESNQEGICDGFVLLEEWDDAP